MISDLFECSLSLVEPSFIGSRPLPPNQHLVYIHTDIVDMITCYKCELRNFCLWQLWKIWSQVQFKILLFKGHVGTQYKNILFQ